MSSKEIKAVHIDDNKRYTFPAKLTTVSYAGMFLIIADEYANWIVLKTKSQLDFFELLKKHSLKEALHLFNGEYEDAKYVVTQIEARKLESVNVVSGAPIRLHMYLTNKCNMRCPHCYMYAGQANENELTTEEIKSVLANYAKSGGVYVTFSGGEISLREDLLILAEYAHSLGLKLQLMTNGVLWNEKSVRKISGFINDVQISIDGYNEDTNSIIRGKGNFDKSLQTVRFFLQENVRVEIAVTPMPDNIDTYVDDYASWGRNLLNEYGKKGLKIKFSGELIDGRNIKLNKEQHNKYITSINKIYTKCYGNSGDQPFIDNIKSRGLMDNCSFGNITISSIGDVFFCGRIEGLRKATNIRDVCWEKIWSLSEKAKIVTNVANIVPCNECSIKYICGGDCRIKYFPEIKTNDIESFNINNKPERECNNAIKEHFYDLMIRTNEQLYQ